MSHFYLITSVNITNWSSCVRSNIWPLQYTYPTSTRYTINKIKNVNNNINYNPFYLKKNMLFLFFRNHPFNCLTIVHSFTERGILVLGLWCQLKSCNIIKDNSFVFGMVWLVAIYFFLYNTVDLFSVWIYFYVNLIL